MTMSELNLEQLEEYKKTLEELMKVKRKEIAEGVIKERTKKPAKKKVCNKTIESRDRQYQFYADYIKCFEMVMGGVASREQLIKYYSLLYNETKEMVKDMIDTFEDYGLVKAIKFQENIIYLLHSFSRVRIYTDKNMKTVRVNNEKLKAMLFRNDVLLLNLEVKVNEVQGTTTAK